MTASCSRSPIRAGAWWRSAGADYRPMPSPNTSTPAKRASFPRGTCSTISPRRGGGDQRAEHHRRRGYMDVIALGARRLRSRRGPARHRTHRRSVASVVACGSRTDPLPSMAMEAGLRAAHRAAHLALPHLKAGYSLRFAFLPAGDDPDSFIRASGPAGMRKILDAALPLGEVLWRVETEGKDFSTPERRAGIGTRAGGNHPGHRGRQDRRLLPPRFRQPGVRGVQAAQTGACAGPHPI